MGERLKNAITGAVLFGLFAANRFLWEDFSLLVRFVTLFTILFHAWWLGKKLLPSRSGKVQAIYGIAFFFSLFAVLETVWFYVGNLGSATDYWTIMGCMVICQIANVMHADRDSIPDPLGSNEWTFRRGLLATIFASISSALFAFIAYGAWHSFTTASIRTPWPLLPTETLVAVMFLWIAVPVSAWLVSSRVLTSIQTVLAFLATTTIAPLVYGLGFGFDGFLHVAGEKHILLTGTLNPKPLYYIGQYVLTTWITRISDLPITLVDRWLVPLAAVVLIPLSAFVATRAESRKRQSLALLSLVFVPLAPFVATTPQSFAYILGVSALFLATGSREEVSWPGPLMLAAWSVAIHPLAGIPFFLLATAVLLLRPMLVPRWTIVRTVFAWILGVAAAASVPLLFFVLSLKGGTEIHWNLSSLFAPEPWKQLAASLTPWIGNRYALWPAWATLIQQALPLLALALGIGTVVILPKERRPMYLVIITSSVLLIMSGLILKTAGDFAFLIDYERGNYAERLILIAVLCLAVTTLPAMAAMFDGARRRPSMFTLLLVLAFGSVAAAQSYNALPRNDALVTGHGWSVGASDIDAVKLIDRDSNQAPYTVLADQSVSAAAVSQFGFKRYAGDVFYYPIPTGGPLYETYLRMTYQEPSRDTAKDAAKLGDSRLVYVVLNDYWWNADRVAESLAAIADTSWTIGDSDKGPGNVVHVYKFDTSNASKR